MGADLMARGRKFGVLLPSRTARVAEDDLIAAKPTMMESRRAATVAGSGHSAGNCSRIAARQAHSAADDLQIVRQLG
jgi:hypothetical protein